MKEIIKGIKEADKTKRGRGLLFFGFYIVFFLLLALLSRTIFISDDNNYVNDTNSISINSTNKFNYHYKYIINVDNIDTIIEGDKLNSKESFTLINENNISKYYKDTNGYYTFNNNERLSILRPNEGLDIVDNLDNILKDAYIVYKTEYESGKEVIKLSVSSATINKDIKGTDLDIEEIPNEIYITYEDNYITEVQLFLNSYCKANNICQESMKMILTYEKFNEIELLS